jgi:predicted DsbA family dithiol-disulfide isomerase
MHDLLFANQRELSPQKYEEWAQQIGLDMDRFRKDSASPAVKKKVDSDAAEAARLGVTGTPGFFVNGRFVSGAKPFASFKQIIDEELNKKG